MSIIFSNELPPLLQSPDVDGQEMDVYCYVRVYGAPKAVVSKTEAGKDYQLFSESASISRGTIMSGGYAGSDMEELRRNMCVSLIRNLKRYRAYADYAIGMPEEFIYRESNGKIIQLPASLYHDLST